MWTWYLNENEQKYADYFHKNIFAPVKPAKRNEAQSNLLHLQQNLGRQGKSIYTYIFYLKSAQPARIHGEYLLAF